MRIIGLAGRPGSGKSAIANTLAQQPGVEWIDLDREAWTTYEPGSMAYDPLISRFGREILTRGKIDRGRLAEIVFRDAQARQDLEAIVHPAVLSLLHGKAAEARARGTSILLVEGAVLVSSTYVNRSDFDAILWLELPDNDRRERLRVQGREEHVDRASGSGPDEGCVVVPTGGTLAEASERVWQTILRLAPVSS